MPTYTRAHVMRLLDDMVVGKGLEGADERADLFAGLKALPEQQRRICYALAYGYSHADIAKGEGVSRPTATRLCKQALGMLVERMNGE